MKQTASSILIYGFFSCLLAYGFFLLGNGYRAKKEFDKGVLAFGTGDLDSAIAHFTATIRLKPGFAGAYYDRGFTYGKQGDIDKAIADFSEVIRLKSDFG